MQNYDINRSIIEPVLGRNAAREAARNLEIVKEEVVQLPLQTSSVGSNSDAEVVHPCYREKSRTHVYSEAT